jgi:hypothetical protein
LAKIGAKVVTHARYVTFQMVEVAIPQHLFRTILRRMAWLGPLGNSANMIRTASAEIETIQDPMGEVCPNLHEQHQRVRPKVAIGP